MKFAFIIPNYNHPQVIDDVLLKIKPYGFPCYLVDDGSNESTRKLLMRLAEEHNWVKYIRMDHNQGKGAAVMTGFEKAYSDGVTHAIQVDADGQHDLKDIVKLVRVAKENPQKLISGQPIYDESIPKSRYYARYLTHVWVWVETLSFGITDSMCGFRVYPLKETCDLIQKQFIGKRMDFDTEIMVKLYWKEVYPIMISTKVIYPKNNTSNFNIWHDNWLITKMHVRLVFGMLIRVPALLLRKCFGKK